MSTVIRSKISEGNSHYISKDRYLELKHFCLQYYEWMDLYNRLELDSIPSGMNYTDMPKKHDISDPTEKVAIAKAQCARNMKMIKDAAKEADSTISDYIFMAVTKNVPYSCLRTKYNIPCGKNYYYSAYRKFFWLLSGARY